MIEIDESNDMEKAESDANSELKDTLEENDSTNEEHQVDTKEENSTSEKTAVDLGYATEEKSRAATIIQSHFRGYRIRKQIQSS